MPLHAGFAAAISIAQDAIQQIVHLEYLNDTFPTTVKDTTKLTNTTADPQFSYSLAYDLVLAEPLILLKPNPNNLVDVRIELIGSLQFSSKIVSEVQCWVDIVMDVQVPVIMISKDKDKTIQLGLDSSKALISDFKTTITKGKNPIHKYGFDLNGFAMKMAALGAIFSIKPDQFLITLPGLKKFFDVNYKLLGPSIRITNGSLNAGIDVQGLTNGNVNDLKDLNAINTVRGWLKKFGPVHTADDEYGEPIYDMIWQPTKQQLNNSHETNIAVMLNKKVVDDLYKKIGRYELFSTFEKIKYNAIVKKLEGLKGGKHTVYDAPMMESLVLNRLDITLHNDHLHIEANATKYGSIEMTTDLRFDLRIIRTEIFGETSFVSSHQDMNGFTGEILNVEVDVPAWVEIANVLGATVGVIVMPILSIMGLPVILIFEMIVSAVVSSVIDEVENELYSSLMQNMLKDNGIFRFNLPGIKKPDLILWAEDIVVRAEGLYSWFVLQIDTDVTATASVKVVNYPKKYSTTTGWPIEAREKIHVKYTEKGKLYSPKDPKVRIRWVLFGNSTQHKLLERDTPVNNSGIDDPLSMFIDHASSAYDKYNLFIVKCRVYRPSGNDTDEIFQQTIEITIADRLDRSKTYVHWQHHVSYFRPPTDPGDMDTALVSEERHSRIHYTDFTKRCLCADRYSLDLTKTELNYSDHLPFPIADIGEHRNKICPYCFFGGPDKHTLKP